MNIINTKSKSKMIFNHLSKKIFLPIILLIFGNTAAQNLDNLNIELQFKDSILKIDALYKIKVKENSDTKYFLLNPGVDSLIIKGNSLNGFEMSSKPNRPLPFWKLNFSRTLKKGETVEQPVYSFVTHNRTEDSVKTHPRKVVIVEGILIFNSEELRRLFDIKIFVHAETDERLIRRVRRDITERGRDIDEVLNRYQTTLKPMHQQFIEPTKNFADIIIPNDRYNTVAIDVVRSVINERL